MCKTKNLTKYRMKNINQHNLIHRFSDINDCETSKCESCKNDICWENDEIRYCEICNKDYCIDCKDLYFCEICEESFCNDCKENIEVNSEIYCKICQENIWWELFDAAYNKKNIKIVEKLIETYNYPHEVINTCYINSIMTFNLDIIKFLMEFTSNYHMFNETALHTFSIFAITTQTQYETAKFLVDKIEKRFALESLIEIMHQNNINDNLAEYIELKITSL